MKLEHQDGVKMYCGAYRLHLHFMLHSQAYSYYNTEFTDV